MKTLTNEQLVVAQLGEAHQINWHPAFFEAIQLELSEYRDVLEFHSEYQLTDEPLRIDCLVIKKAKNVAIKKNIATIFRKWNILEYKSPDDYVSIGDFYKAHAYAYQLAWLKKTSITGMTISFVGSRYPRKLIRHLEKELECTVAKTAPGVYTVTGGMLPVQIIDSRELPSDENLWLKSLRRIVDPFEAARIIEVLTRRGKDARIGAYLDAIAKANLQKIQEAIKMTESTTLMGSGSPTFDRLLEEAGWTAKWEAQGEARGQSAKSLEIARKMKNAGRPFAEIVEFTDLPIETVEQL